MNASMSRTPWAAQASTARWASSAVKPSGFSHRTCLPASAALVVHSTWRWLGSGM